MEIAGQACAMCLSADWRSVDGVFVARFLRVVALSVRLGGRLAALVSIQKSLQSSQSGKS